MVNESPDLSPPSPSKPIPQTDVAQDVENDIRDFSDWLALKSVLFSMMGLTEQSGRVQSWLSKRQKSSLDELSFEEYRLFCLTVQKAWFRDCNQTAILRHRIDEYFRRLDLHWNHPLILEFMQTPAIRQDGLTPPHLQRICEALQREIEDNQE